MALNVKKGDNVLVIAGKDKGKSGKVLVAMPADNSVVVAGVNIIAKHKKAKNANDKGGIIKKEGKFDASNVMVICPACGKATRIGHAEKDGKNVRLCKKCGVNLDSEIKKETKKPATKTVEKKVEEVKEATSVEDSKPATKTTAKKTTTKSTSTTKKSTTKKVESK